MELIDIISAMYASSEGPVLVNNKIGDTFSTTVSIRQGCLLSPVLFIIFLKKIMQDILKYHISTIPISNLRFEDDIYLIVCSSN